MACEIVSSRIYVDASTSYTSCILKCEMNIKNKNLSNKKLPKAPTIGKHIFSLEETRYKSENNRDVKNLR